MKKVIIVLIILTASVCFAEEKFKLYDPSKGGYSDAAWDHLTTTLNNFSANEYVDFLEKRGFKGNHIGVTVNGRTKSFKFGGAEFLDFIRIAEAAYNGDWKVAREQSAETAIGYFYPLVGQYMGLHKTARIAIESVIANWSDELYETRAYKDLLDILNDQVLAAAKNREPYIPSYSLDPGTPLRQRMVDYEDRMYSVWMSKSPDIEIQTGGNPARIRQILGHDFEDMREVFNHFLVQIVYNQRGYIQTTFNRVTEQAAKEAALEVKKQAFESARIALKKSLDALSRPHEVRFSPPASLAFKGAPGYEYTLSVYLESGDTERKVYNKRITLPVSGVFSEELELDSTPKGGDKLHAIITDPYGQSEGDQFAVKGDNLNPFTIKASLSTYDGEPINRAVQNGEILAFQANVSHTKVEPAPLSILTWQVNDATGSPLPGLVKQDTGIASGETKNYRFRFRLDSLPDGRYTVSLRHCIDGMPESCVSSDTPFTIAQSVAIDRIDISSHSSGSPDTDTLYNDEEVYIYAYFTSNEGSIKADFIVKDKETGKVYTNLSHDKDISGSSSEHRTGIVLRPSTVPAGSKAVAEVTITAPDGRKMTKTREFSKDFYTVGAKHPTYMKHSQRSTAQLNIPSRFKPPYRINANHSSSLSMNISDSGRMDMTANPVLEFENAFVKYTVKDSEGRIGKGSFNLQLEGETKVASTPSKPFPKLREEIPITPPEPVPVPVPTKPSYTPKKSQPAKPQMSSYDAIRLGQRRYRHITDRIANEMIPPCVPNRSSMVRNIQNSGNQQIYKELGYMSEATFSVEQSKMVVQTFRTIKKGFSKLHYDKCMGQWLDLLERNGYLSSGERHSIEGRLKSRMPRYHYAYIETEKFQAIRRCRVVKGKPRTGMMTKIHNKTFNNVYKTWAIAVGPATPEASQRFCNEYVNNKRNFNAYNSPWRPTGGSHGWQMDPNREYIMKNPYDSYMSGR
ncbi:carboxypeptidase-like regulatory domain-containing protein [Limisalsivibrio acetivorans]|uniref:carboxypeptidase-like regulatory domain-containing protein n=1 Tax=Limisalsivibrio acetivorans TaxID=1304888 RepID=UPI0003B420E6|nr:carboxypeptidase-like regulatory domain-containing protein [Limisalsivibrio acetivorans]